ncbi:MAG: hypothetical protein CM15mP74_05550 [Halieaceae bacterium]|nr:MAG: hypothetical protein CM15mP74_05550 [Halieaceae bacterium]
MDDGTALTSPAGYVDLYGTIQHEIGHGLGFASYYASSGTFPVSGATDSFSQYLYNEVTSRSIDNDVSDP